MISLAAGGARGAPGLLLPMLGAAALIGGPSFGVWLWRRRGIEVDECMDRGG